MDKPRIGVAGWSLPRRAAEAFPAEGSGLQRYAARLNCAEINSTFYRSHRPGVLERWAASTPDDFRFSVKAPKAVTHELRLVDCEARLAQFAGEIAALGDKLGPVLFQLPPSFAYDPDISRRAFEHWRGLFDSATVCEPRHASWFEREADELLAGLRIARVAADPARVPAAAEPGGWPGLAYYRWHGSPAMYKSDYDEAALAGLATEIASAKRPAWAIFDNTMFGGATVNALRLSALLSA
jgi:uncharacterized protein YecE (DUF72 family)